MPKSTAKKSPVTSPLAAPLTALFKRKGTSGFTVLSAVSGVPVDRLNALRDGAQPDLMEKITLESLAEFS